MFIVISFAISIAAQQLRLFAAQEIGKHENSAHQIESKRNWFEATEINFLPFKRAIYSPNQPLLNKGGQLAPDKLPHIEV